MSLKIGPGAFVILDSVAGIKGALEGADDSLWATGHEIDHGLAFQIGATVFDDLLPILAAWAFAVFQIADARQPLGAGPGDAAIAVIPGARLVFLEHGEVNAVDLDQLVKGQAELLGHQYVDFDQRHPAGKFGAEAGVADPC